MIINQGGQSKKKIETVPSQSGSLIYNGSTQTPVWNNYNPEQLTITGVASAVDAGTYTVAFTPTSRYKWSDGSTAAKTVEWSIRRKSLSAVPSQSGTLTYTGNSQSPSWSNYNGSQLTIGGTTAGTNAGSYAATFTPNSNHMWSDGTIVTKYVGWSIGRKSVSAVPAQRGSLTYTGGSQSPTWASYNNGQLTIGGATSGIDAGTYTATFTPNSNHQWSDGTIDAKSVNWTINKKALSTVPSQSGSLTFTGGNQSPTWSNYDSGQLTIGGATSGVNAGTYTATFTPTSNYKWSDNSASKSVNWSIGRQAISAVPSQSGSLTYTGGAQSPSWANYDSNKMTLGGATSGTNAGGYIATFTPKDNYKWSDNSTSAKSVGWSIAKAAGSLSLSATSGIIPCVGDALTFTVSKSGDGAISVSTSNGNIAVASLSGTTVTVSAIGLGAATITVSVAAGTNHNAPTNKTYTVSVYNCLYFYGNLCTPASGGWSARGWKWGGSITNVITPSIVNNSNHMKITLGSGYLVTGAVEVLKDQNLTGVNKITVDFEATSYAYIIRLLVIPRNIEWLDENVGYVDLQPYGDQQTTGRKTVSLDVSGINGSYDVVIAFINAWSGGCNATMNLFSVLKE